MSGATLQIFIAMISYMLVVIGIGLYFAKRANESSENYFLGGRTLGPWIAAMSAEASDMSGWLLMGLPGVAYWCGLADAAWTAIGLAVGTYLNWLLVSKRLRRYSAVAGNAITIPDYFSNRFHDNKKILMSIAAIFILVFFTVYTASCFVTCGKLFSALFGFSYHSMMFAGAVFVVLYTFLGGFLAESTSDFLQSVVMIIALVAILSVSTIAAGGPAVILQNVKSIPGFWEFFGIAQPATINGVQQIQNGTGLFCPAAPYGLLTILSTVSWGLGYFGMPQVLLRFMAIQKADDLKKSRRLATSWAVICMFSAVMIGVIGRVLYPAALTTSGNAENIFIIMSSNLLPPLLAGLAMAGILAATISSSDSYMLIAASAFSKNMFQCVLKKDATDKQVMNVSRVTLLTITALGMVIAMDETSIIFKVVSFAWAGFGATFGPIMLFSLFWKRTNIQGAIAGMLAGGISVFVWKLLVRPIGGVWGLYELGPAFLISCIFIVTVSMLTRKPSDEMLQEFEKAKTFVC